MSLTAQSVKTQALKDVFNITKSDAQHVIVLAGNPNTGKSTVFNYLTGLKQHTGNWPGKTVVSARGEYVYNNEEYVLVDLPGSYSLFTSSKDEEVSRDFLCYGDYDAVIVVADATCLERNLNLVFQISEITNKVVLCINLIDEAKKKNIVLDKEGLEKELNIPIVLTAARSGLGMHELKEMVEQVALSNKKYTPNLIQYDSSIEKKANEIIPYLNEMNISQIRWTALRLLDSPPSLFSFEKNNHLTEEKANYLIHTLQLDSNRTIIREKISKQNYDYANYLVEKYVKEDTRKINRDKKIDDIITSKIFGIPIMLALLGLIFWITIQGANIPSQFLSNTLFGFQAVLNDWFIKLGVSGFLRGILLDGMYRTLAWVVSVMLPPMAIFFPLFSLLEDLGYLPRVAFNLDHLFKKACAHGKQSLCMCMVRNMLRCFNLYFQ